jgi:CRISPR-associated protein Cas6
MVDVVFELAAERLAEGYEWPLFQAVARLTPWIADCPSAGILPVRGTRAPEGDLLVARRAKLVVRVPRDRVCAASALEGAVLDLGRSRATLGRGAFRNFHPAPTLYSPRVVTGEMQEEPFTESVAAELAALDIRRPILCGRRVQVTFAQEAHTAFSVAVHGLDDAQSLLLQRAGLGRGHAVGCGLLVPHKTITAPG